MNEQENADAGQNISDLKRREADLIQRLDRFVLLRVNGEIGAERLSHLTNETERDLNSVRIAISQLHGHSIDWAHIANQYLTFAEKARERFKNGGPDEKKRILQGLSSNLILKDKILTVSLPKPLLGIQTTYEIFKRESEGFEPEKNGGDQALFRGVAPDLNTGPPALYKVRTAILEADFHAVPSL